MSVADYGDALFFARFPRGYLTAYIFTFPLNPPLEKGDCEGLLGAVRGSEGLLEGVRGFPKLPKFPKLLKFPTYI